MIGIAAAALLAWTAFAHPLSAHGPKQTYVVKPYDTLWSIASSRYAGDTRDAVYRIEQANDLAGGVLRPGQVIVLP
jgi:LysM repeat protein